MLDQRTTEPAPPGTGVDIEVLKAAVFMGVKRRWMKVEVREADWLGAARHDAEQVEVRVDQARIRQLMLLRGDWIGPPAQVVQPHGLPGCVRETLGLDVRDIDVH